MPTLISQILICQVVLDIIAAGVKMSKDLSNVFAGIHLGMPAHSLDLPKGTEYSIISRKY